MRFPQTNFPSSVSDEAIERFLAGRSEAIEAEQVRSYLIAYPGVALYYQSLRAGLGGSAVGVGSIEAERAYGHFVQRREELAQNTQASEPRSTRHKKTWFRQREVAANASSRITRYTLASALVAVVAIVMWRGSSLIRNTRSNALPTTYATSNAQRANIMLPDGSTVMLDVASRLDVPADFAVGHRTVQLTGEALFSVTHHNGVPFTVITGQTTTRVLGTAFVVRRYGTDTTTTIAVRDGKIAVGAVVLTAWQQVTVAPSGAVAVRPADSAQFTFAKGVLTLNGVPLKDAIVDLDRWYDVDIRLADPALGVNLVQGAFVAGSPSDLSSILSFTFHTRVAREGRTITLYPK